MRTIIRLLFFLLALGIVGVLIKLGFDYKDIFYYILAAIIFLVTAGSLVKREKLPQLNIPKIKLRINLREIFKRINRANLSKLKKSYFNKKMFRGNIAYKLIGTIIISISLAYLIIYQLPSSVPEKNFFTNLIQSFMTYSKEYSAFLFPLTLVLITFNLITTLRAGKEKSRVRALSSSLFSSFAELIISAPISLLFVFLFVLIFYNSLIAASGFYPKLLNIHIDNNDIKQIIEKSDATFEFVGITGTPSKTFIINSPFFGQKSDYFTTNFVPSMPNFLLLSSKTIDRPIYLINNTIVIKWLDKDFLQTIAPTLVKKLLKRDLASRYIKNEPDVEIISRQDYLKYREDEINKQIDIITGYINEAKKTLNTLAYNIQVSKTNIATLQNYIAMNSLYRDQEYNYCINATGTYYGFYYNYTYRLYSDEYCQSQRNQRDQQNAEYQNELTRNQKDLGYYQSQYNEFKQYIDQFQNYKAFVEATKDLTPYELGLFEPDKSVKVVLDSVSSKDISNFLETLTHEYIHYTSYVSEERTLPQFFEEGITEYLARKVISDQLHKSVNLGYPVVVKVISVMAQKISTSQLENIYFNKSTDELISLLDQTYGKDFYKDTELYFALIPYSPPDEALKFANNIMFKIEGPQLTDKDLEIIN